MSCQRDTLRQVEGWVAYYQRPGHHGTWLNPVVDISVGGTFLRTSTPMKPGETFEVILISKNDPTCISTEAEVVWAGRKERHRGMGLRFRHNRTSLAVMREMIN
jgi:Tfp pilus assembly protein PilZ